MKIEAKSRLVAVESIGDNKQKSSIEKATSYVHERLKYLESLLSQEKSFLAELGKILDSDLSNLNLSIKSSDLGSFLIGADTTIIYLDSSKVKFPQVDPMLLKGLTIGKFKVYGASITPQTIRIVVDL
jgi:hypothetical protein